MTKNLLIITQKVDENDDLLGFFASWIPEFAQNFNKVFVIALAKGEYELPDNVFIYSLGKEFQSSRVARFIKFYWYLLRLIPKSSGVFAHMSPIFAIMAWPIAAIFRKRVVFWYLHRSVTGRLRLAEKLCYKIATSTKESLQLKSKKIVEVGHGIDIEKFKTEREWNDLSSRKIRVLSVGRISKIKDYETLIKAAAILRDKSFPPTADQPKAKKFKVKIVGRPVMSYDFEYFEKLKKMVGDLGLKNFIEFAGFAPYSQISDYYKEADIFVNMAPGGGIDKAVLEAMASGSLVLVSNQVFKKYFGGYDLFFKYGDFENLAGKILELINFSSGEAEKISNFLVESVKTNHDLGRTIKKISNFFN